MRPQRKLNQARALRRNSTPAEARLWEQLRNRQLNGFKFIRQAKIGPFITDFLCRERKLVIELDGWTHSTSEELAYNARRTAYLQAQGFNVLRFANVEALEGMDTLLVIVSEALNK
jgi:very-short-patch-repair endonuclease